MSDVSYDDFMKLAAVLQPQIFRQDGEHPFVVVPDGFSVHNLQTALPAPTRIRQAATFTETDSFIEYVKEYGADTSKFFADRHSLSIVCAVDYHQPELPSFSTHKATLKLRPSPEWITWSTASGSKMEQVEFAHFLEKNILDIREPKGGEVLEIASTLEAKKGVSFKSGVQLTNGQRVFVYEEEIKGAAGKDGRLTIPERFKLALRPFEGADLYEIEAFFRYRIDSNQLKLWFELIRPDKVTEAAFDDVVETIEDQTERSVLIGSIG